MKELYFFLFVFSFTDTDDSQERDSQPYSFYTFHQLRKKIWTDLVFLTQVIPALLEFMPFFKKILVWNQIWF